jgi:hypothetical protein
LQFNSGSGFEIGRHKGWTVLVALALAGASLAALSLWYALGRFFGQRFRFTPRLIVSLVLALAIPCGWFAAELRQARKQQAAVERLEGLGCQIDYLPASDCPEHAMLSREPRAPSTLFRRLLGDCFFEDAGRADCETSNQPEECLDSLRDLPQLRELWLGHSESWPDDQQGGRVTDAGLCNLRSLSHLETLKITGSPQLSDSGLENLSNLGALHRLEISGERAVRNTGQVIGGLGITDAGLESLGALPNLRELSISGGSSITAAGLRDTERFQNLQRLVLWDCPVSDAGLERLKHLRGLRVLGLTDTNVTDAGLRHVGAMTELRALSLDGTKVGDAGMEHLKGLTKLGNLSLEGTRVGDAGLKYLSGLTQLEQLKLRDTKVSDAGLEHLKGLTSLRGLDLTGTKVSQAASDAFRRSDRLDQFRFVRDICESYLAEEVMVSHRGWVYIDPFGD